MDILKIQVLKGPNFWSIHRKKLIVFKIDIKQYEYLPTNLIPNFSDNLKKLLPSLYSHRCSEGVEGGFYSRLKDGTWLGHVIEHIALELQTLAGMFCGFGRTFGPAAPGIYHVIFAFEMEKAGIYAGKAAMEIVQTLAAGKPYLHLEKDLYKLRSLHEEEKLGPSTQAIYDEAIKRNIPVSVLKDTSLITLGQGSKQKRMWGTISSETDAIAVDIASNKDITKKLLAVNYIPIPESTIVKDLQTLTLALSQIGFPLVLKPLNGNHGKGITTNILTEEQAIAAFQIAVKSSESVIVERYVKGDDYRFLVVNYKVVAVARRTAAFITGDGVSSIKDLIATINQDPKRGKEHENILTLIEMDEATLSIIAARKLTVDSILPIGEVFFLKYTANLSTGGTAEDVTDLVHPANIRLGEQIAELMHLDICGIDIIAKDIKKPINSQNGSVLEVNASPGFRMHILPCKGKPRNVAAPVLDMLYPKESTSRIPIIAVTGTNGKTTVVRMLETIAKKHHRVGMTTTEGIYRTGQLLYKGDCSGPQSAVRILQDPSVDFAILECARGGILREGLGFDHCNISIITNISNDHLGLCDIESLEDLAKVKGVVAESTLTDGYAILNAEDDLVYKLKEELKCNIALFALVENERIKAHCKNGGAAIYLSNNQIVLAKDHKQEIITTVGAIPCTDQGRAYCMIKNILPTILAATLAQFPMSEIVSALCHFQSNEETNPGRMNLFSFDHFRILLDYAHNEAAYSELKLYMDKITAKRKIGIIAAVGDRRDEDIQKMGFYAGQIFDEIIIRHNKDRRGRSNSELTKLLLQGINKANCNLEINIISDEIEALYYAINKAKEDAFIYHSIDDVSKALNFVKKIQKNRSKYIGKYHATTKREVVVNRWSRG